MTTRGRVIWIALNLAGAVFVPQLYAAAAAALFIYAAIIA